MRKVIQEVKSTLWRLKLANWLFDYPSFKNNVICKAAYRAFIELNKDYLSQFIKEGNGVCKEFDEIDEQLDENGRELKNIVGEILEEATLFIKKFDEDEERENEKKLKNNIIAIIKLCLL